MFTSCELGVFDVLHTAGRPLSAEDVSKAIGASLDGTERLLAACAGLQLLQTHCDDGQGQFWRQFFCLTILRAKPLTRSAV